MNNQNFPLYSLTIIWYLSSFACPRILKYHLILPGLLSLAFCSHSSSSAISWSPLPGSCNLLRGFLRSSRFIQKPQRSATQFLHSCTLLLSHHLLLREMFGQQQASDSTLLHANSLPSVIVCTSTCISTSSLITAHRLQNHCMLFS